MTLQPSSNRPNHDLPGASVWLGHWILFGASCNIAGWALSAAGRLNAVGLCVTVPLCWLLLAKLAGLRRPTGFPAQLLASRRKRFAQVMPALFLLLALLSLLAGLLYPPNNFDALIYRMPRVCDWLMAGRWEWIATTKNNLNTRSAGIEWWSAPMIALLRTDRLLFLINLVSFTFFPGILFNLFRNIGVRSRVAYAWMWILPAGYCFVLQAASVGNDMLAAFFAIAAFDFGFRWKQSGSHTPFALALLSCALMTAVKPTTLPLLLPFGLLFLGMVRTGMRRPVVTLVLVFLFGFASFLPTAAINVRKCGDWTGAAAEDQKLGKVEPLVGIATNTINATIQNVIPPVFPLAGTWNRTIPTLFPKSYIEANLRSFESGGANFSIPDFQGEEQAGAGTGVTLLLVVSVLAGLVVRRSSGKPSPLHEPRSRRTWVILSSTVAVALLAYFSKAGMTTVGRHIAPFYPFLFGICLVGTQQIPVVRNRLWHALAIVTMVSSVLLMIIVPSRPLWPAHSFLSRVNQTSSAILQRAKSGYGVYATRADGLGPVREALPKDALTVGYLNHGVSPELPLWKPYMKRRLRHILPDETLETLRGEDIRCLVLNTQHFEKRRNLPPDEWVSRHGGIVKERFSLQLLAQEPPAEWWIVEIPFSKP